MQLKEFFRFLKSLPKSLILALITQMPLEAGVLLRRWYYSRRFAKCGKDLWVGTNVLISNPGLIEAGDDVKIRENTIIHTGRQKPFSVDGREVIELTPDKKEFKGRVILGDHSRIAFGALILAYGGVKIGEKCGIGPGAVILSESFHHKGRQKDRIYKYSQGAQPEEQCVVQGFVEFKDGAGVASHVIVLPGAIIGRDSWVGPNSVVGIRGRVEEDVIAKGDPAIAVFHRQYLRE